MWQAATTIDPAVHRRRVSESSPARRQPRLARRVPCRLWLWEAEERSSKALVGQTVHVWQGGLAVQLSQGLDPRSLVELQVPDGGGEIVTLHGSVAYSRRVVSGTYEVGVSLS